MFNISPYSSKQSHASIVPCSYVPCFHFIIKVFDIRDRTKTYELYLFKYIIFKGKTEFYQNEFYQRVLSKTSSIKFNQV